jgi:hypothetical protein
MMIAIMAVYLVLLLVLWSRDGAQAVRSASGARRPVADRPDSVRPDA